MVRCAWADQHEPLQPEVGWRVEECLSLEARWWCAEPSWRFGYFEQHGSPQHCSKCLIGLP